MPTSYDPEKHHRRSIRRKGYDYTQSGAYFITLCTHHRESWFGHIHNRQMHLNADGRIVAAEWLNTSQLRPYVRLDEWVIMPDHFHAIVVIDRAVPFIAATAGPLQGTSHTLGAIVRGFKGATTRAINQTRSTPDTRIWQRNYHERIIRDARALQAIRRYIRENPSR
jgi:REP element-mobilizing transposase RayT